MESLYQGKVSSSSFYGEYHGHKIEHLKILYPVLRESSTRIIWTAGDSSLDNKYWFNDKRDAVGAYARVLQPPVSNADVTYWLNHHGTSESRTHKIATINTAVEATTLNQRTFRLRPQDQFLRENIQADDILICSIGGNDIALSPTPCTILSLLLLPKFCLDYGSTIGSVPVDDYCCGCGPSLASCACAFPPCLGYLVHLFGMRVQKYLEKLTSKIRPKKILVCMIYYPDENLTPSWAGPALGALGYNSNPEGIQKLIRKIFVEATLSIRIPGSEVIPVPLFHPLNGKNPRDYVARVEPSSRGGEKMAEYFLDIIDGSDRQYTPTSPQIPVESSYMAERD